MVLLHGFPGRWQEFLPIMPNLVFSYHLYALDLRGQGKSGRTAGEYHTNFYGQDILAFLNHEIVEPVILFGMSAGGIVALDVAAQSPGKVRAIILGDSPIDFKWLKSLMKSDEFIALFSAYRDLAALDKSIDYVYDALMQIPVQIPGETEPVRYADQPGLDAIDLLRKAKTLSMLDPGALDYHAEGRVDEFFEGFELEKMLDKITCPVLLVQADPKLGGMMTDESVDIAMSVLPNATHVYMEGSGHDLGLDTWNLSPLLRVVIGFLEALN